MFIHSVLFEVANKEAPKYHRDCLMWADYASKARGFVACFTMKRLGFKNQYASVYQWESREDHGRFMKKFHDWLKNKSRARVKVLGYYNLKAVNKLAGKVILK